MDVPRYLRCIDPAVCRSAKAAQTDLAAANCEAGFRVIGTDKKPESVHIVVDEVDPDNWGFSGKLTSELRKQSA